LTQHSAGFRPGIVRAKPGQSGSRRSIDDHTQRLNRTNEFRLLFEGVSASLKIFESGCPRDSNQHDR